jgi:hypothetical protein
LYRDVTSGVPDMECSKPFTWSSKWLARCRRRKPRRIIYNRSIE